MAENKSTTSGRSHNQPSREAQMKGGQQSHSGSSNTANDTKSQQSGQSGDGRSHNQPGHNQPSHEASVKGGQHSHSGSSK